MSLILFGACANKSSPKYQVSNITSSFDSELSEKSINILKKKIDESFSLMPRHTIWALKGLKINFVTDNACRWEAHASACFVRREYTIYIKTTEPVSALNHLETTIVHELAHALDYRLTWFRPPLLKDVYEADTKRPTKYAGKNSKEDFAESLEFYIFYPEKLRDCCPQRYAFIEKNIINEDTFNLHLKRAEAAKPHTIELLAFYALVTAAVASAFALLGLLARKIVRKNFVIKSINFLHIISIILFFISIGLFLAHLVFFTPLPEMIF